MFFEKPESTSIKRKKWRKLVMTFTSQGYCSDNNNMGAFIGQETLLKKIKKDTRLRFTLPENR